MRGNTASFIEPRRNKQVNCQSVAHLTELATYVRHSESTEPSREARVGT